MDALSTQTTSTGQFNGIETDPRNNRDRGGYLNTVLTDREEIEQLADRIDNGAGFEDYDGFTQSENQRTVLRTIISDNALEEFHSRSYPASINQEYSLEATVPLGDGMNLGWIGTVDQNLSAAPSSNYTHRAGEIHEALEPGNDSETALPEGYTQEYLDGQATLQDRRQTLDLWRDNFNDEYVVSLDMDFVDSFYEGNVLGSVVRDSEGDIVSTAAAEPARVPTAVGDLEIVELSEFATDPEHAGQGLAEYNGAAVLEPVQEYGVDAVYSQNNAAQPAMSAIATNLGGEMAGILRSHANVENQSQDLVLTYFPNEV